MKGQVLCIDIGGSHIKASVVDRKGEMVCDRVEQPTPNPASPAAVTKMIAALASRVARYDRVSMGFPGVVRDGRIYTAPNLGTKLWRGFALAERVAAELKKPVRVLNDAEVQGLGVIGGQGLEFVVTLGTGFGSALFRDGELMPHLELGQHPAWNRKTYDQYLGEAALARHGTKTWNRHLERAIGFISTLLNYDRLYIGGGNVRKVTLQLPKNVTRVANEAGITGGVRLWDPAFDRVFSRTKQRKGRISR